MFDGLQGEIFALLRGAADGLENTALSPPIQRASGSPSTPMHHMRINHRSLDILVPSEFLHRAHVGAVFQPRCGEAGTKRMTADRLGYTSLPYGSVDGARQHERHDVMASNRPAAGLARTSGSRKDVLPGPVTRGVGVFSASGIGQIDVAKMPWMR